LITYVFLQVTKWALHALFFFEAELKLENFVKQRRRWNNGTAAGYFFLVRDCWSMIWLDGNGKHTLPGCFCWPFWQIAVTIMVFCELFKYLIVVVTPSLFIVGLHLALGQSWVFGIPDADSTKSNSKDSADSTFILGKFGEMFYVEGFTFCYTLLYVYFAVSHCKTTDKTKDRDFQGWTFMLAIIANAVIMCLSFVGIGLSVSQGIASFQVDMQFIGSPAPLPPMYELEHTVEQINQAFKSFKGAEMEAVLDDLRLEQAGLVAHQFDTLNSPKMPWMPCKPQRAKHAKKSECEAVAELEILMDRQTGGSYEYDLHQGFQGGFVSSTLISETMSKIRAHFVVGDASLKHFVPLRTAVSGAASEVGQTPGGVLLNTWDFTAPNITRAWTSNMLNDEKDGE
jgi:hypothetical protein